MARRRRRVLLLLLRFERPAGECVQQAGDRDHPQSENPLPHVRLPFDAWRPRHEPWCVRAGVADADLNCGRQSTAGADGIAASSTRYQGYCGGLVGSFSAGR